jgi:hypothetical protein
MWKKLEDRAAEAAGYVDYNFRLENQVKMRKQQLATLSLRAISHKSSYDFTAFRSDYLANNVTVLTLRAESAESNVAGAPARPGAFPRPLRALRRLRSSRLVRGPAPAATPVPQHPPIHPSAPS